MTINTLVLGHRGSAGTHPENTMVSFQAALDAGAEGIEFDVHLTKDLIPVIMHDETVDRTTNGTGWIKNLTFRELQELDAGNWFDPAFKGASIPSLEDVLQWAAPTSLLLNIELKSGVVRYPGIEKIVLDLVNKYDLKNRVILSSFNHYSVVEIHQLNPEIETAIIFMEGIYEPWDYAKRIGASGLHCYLPVAVPELLMGARNAGMPVRPFTVNEESHITSLMKGEVSAIITDWPEKAVQIRKALSNT